MPAVIWRSIGALRFGCYLLESPYRIRDSVLSRVGAFLLVSRNVAGSQGSNEGHDLEQVRIDLMGQSRERVGRSGDLRYTAYYTTSPDGAARLHLPNGEAGQQGMAERRGQGRRGTRHRPAARPSAIPPLRRGGVVPEPPARTHVPAELQLLPEQAHPARFRRVPAMKSRPATCGRG